VRLDRFIENTLARSARSVRVLFAERKITVNGVAVDNGRQHISSFCRVEVEGITLQARTPLYLMLHKPKGCVSATIDTKNTTVLDLIDLPGKEELHLAGRLDFNTTGLLLLTNDGAWSRKITQPEERIPKIYRVETRDVITPEYVEKFKAGMYFRFENLTTQPAQLQILSATTAELTIYEGRYHQIKRMFGFFQNEVIGLHRLSMGAIALDAQLQAGEYRDLSLAEIAAV
jgi:16S rRNA pseudouridine516 synthase